jgi:signal transduction histidine kinase
MQRETDRLIRLVNELLVLTRADAGSLQLEIQPLDLGELAKQRCEVLFDLAGRQGVHLKVEDGTGESTRVLADPDRLSQVLDNLLENAIRHSPGDSTITVLVNEAGSQISCAVSDEGYGIPPEHLPFIFERFYRVDKARDRHRGGTGLGLAITRALIHAQGGTITAQSVVGKGTAIRFLLPRTPTSGPKGMLRKDVGVQD